MTVPAVLRCTFTVLYSYTKKEKRNVCSDLFGGGSEGLEGDEVVAGEERLVESNDLLLDLSVVQLAEAGEHDGWNRVIRCDQGGESATRVAVITCDPWRHTDVVVALRFEDLYDFLLLDGLVLGCECQLPTEEGGGVGGMHTGLGRRGVGSEEGFDFVGIDLDSCDVKTQAQSTRRANSRPKSRGQILASLRFIQMLFTTTLSCGRHQLEHKEHGRERDADALLIK
jgi:hypothetical protein